MFRFFKELYLTGFTISFRTGGAGWARGINVGKGVVGVTLIEWAIIIGTDCWIEMVARVQLLLNANRPTIAVVFLALYLANYYFLVVRGHGIRYEQEFTKLEKSRKVLLVASCLGVILTAISFFFYSAIVHRRFLGIPN